MLARTVRVMVLLGLGVFFFASLALAGEKTIKLNQDVVLPGGQTLQAGEYAVVVNEKLDEVQFVQNSKVVATHACKCIMQEKKNPENSVVTETQEGGQKVLLQVRLRGETRIITLPS